MPLADPVPAHRVARRSRLGPGHDRHRGASRRTARCRSAARGPRGHHRRGHRIRYQIVVMYMLLAATALGALTTARVAEQALFDDTQRLVRLPDR
ncbi:hypothetical protein C5E45_01185 [Nocardia nova]|uniref:Uncharacterized protein n=1 Tax=Nocardia nova TaxID=37330 RepID=A0A2S6AX03_9NOCA|nr:hypothetical protein C5E41_02270 [Nocardia nova]PPJ39786.1 hypothetical protein C5E45_01185 [Nocardia nova]